MLAIDFKGANTRLQRPLNMTDEECAEISAYTDVDAGGFPFIATYWMPSKEDLEALNAGRGIWVKVIGETTPPFGMFTMDENLKANI